jgi:hypothetical protein
VDVKDKTEELIRQFGEGSEFGKKQEAKRKECEARVKRIHSKVKNLKTATPAKWVRTTQEVARLVAKEQADRVISRTWFHFDLDMFFAACETQL